MSLPITLNCSNTLGLGSWRLWERLCKMVHSLRQERVQSSSTVLEWVELLPRLIRLLPLHIGRPCIKEQSRQLLLSLPRDHLDLNGACLVRPIVLNAASLILKTWSATASTERNQEISFLQRAKLLGQSCMIWLLALLKPLAISQVILGSSLRQIWTRMPLSMD